MPIHRYKGSVSMRKLLVGRERELARLERGLELVPVAVITGAAGVGKSALARAYAARWPGTVIFVTDGVAVEGEIARQLGAGDPWTAVDAHAALVVVDDLQRYAAPCELVRAALRSLVRGRLVVVSRELVSLEASDPDRLELRLDGLDRAAAGELWGMLAALYGDGCDFEVAWRHSRGNPSMLREIQRAGGDPDRLYIDATCHELRAGSLRRSLATRASLRALLYAFASASGHVLDREAIAHALWETAYVPLRHDSSVKSSIRRLRELLTGTGAAIASVRDGYQLVAPMPIVFVAPVRLRAVERARGAA